MTSSCGAVVSYVPPFDTFWGSQYNHSQYRKGLVAFVYAFGEVDT